MKIFGMGGLELVIILVVILLIFGPKNLPKLGSAIGKTVSNLRAGMGEGKKKKEAGKDEASEGEEADVETKPIKGQLEEGTENEAITEGADVETSDDETVEVTQAAGEPGKPPVRRVVKKVKRS